MLPANGNRTSLRKRDGQIIGYTYDALNRVTVKDIPNSTTADVHYAYDLRGLQTEARFGSLTGEGVSNAYDGMGRITSSTTNMGGTSRALSYLYDANSNRTRVTHPDGQYFTYDHDGLDRPGAILENGSAGIVTLGYNAQVQRAALNRGASNGSSYTYDTGRLASITHNVDGAGAANDVSFSFGYNPASQMISRSITNDAYAAVNHYNVARPYQVNGLNQYVSAGPAAFAHDANGNLTSDGSVSYGYDVENRLVSASGAKSASLKYDPLGRLYETSGGSAGTTRFLYDGDALVAEYDGNGNLLRRYVHGAGVDEPLAWYEGAGVSEAARRYLYADHQGSVVAVTQANGTTLKVNGYDEWGIANEDNLGRFAYTGQIVIPEIGFYHYKARIYSPTLGRFLQTDPIGYDDQINLYAYVANDPVNSVDPTGTQSWDGVQEALDWVGFTPAGIVTDPVNAAISAARGDWVGAGINLAATVPVIGDAVKGVDKAVDITKAARGAAGGERAGRSFTQRGREVIDRRNVERHAKPTCENCKREVTPGQRHERGVTPPGNERQRDHIIPRSQGGDGTPKNGQVLCRDCNLKKSDRIPD